MPDAFDMLGEAVTTDKGTILDYPSSFGEAFGAGLERAVDTNPVALGARMLRTFNEDWDARFGNGELVDQKTAEEEVRARGLDLKIPKGGITRYELDTLQYLKQREVRQNTVAARAPGIMGAAAGFAGGVAGSFTDPVNVASNFIPVVGQYRYARWLAQASESSLARAGVRAGAGALEGAVGAALVEPLVYAGATSLQLDYSSVDSFLNVTIGGVMGGGLHTIGGAVYDARVSRAMRGLDQGIVGNAALVREAAANAPEHVRREALHVMVDALERDVPGDVAPVFARHIGQLPRTFDEFVSSKAEQAWVDEPGGLRVYVRRSVHELDGRTVETLDIPTVTAETKGAGAFTSFMRRVEDAPFDAVYVENVLNEDLVRFLDRNGFKKDRAAVGGPPSYFKWTRAAVEPNDIDRMVASFNEKHQGPDRAAHRATAEAEWVPIREAMKRRRMPFVGSSRPEVGMGRQVATSLPGGPRNLSDLIQDARTLRTEDAFNRQFVEDEAASKAADVAVTKGSEDLATVAEDVKFIDEHIKGMKTRDLWTKADDAALEEGEAKAAGLEKEASIYRAAAACMAE
jgi:hypothetical protein